jgi:hypothetical protein
MVTVLQGGRDEFRLGQRLSAAATATFEGLSVTEHPSGTVLLGHVRDDAELRGILSRMQGLQLRILDVHRLPD